VIYDIFHRFVPVRDTVTTRSKLLWPELVPLRVKVVVRTDFLMAVEAKWNTIVLIIRAARRLVNNVGGFNVCSTLLQTKAAESTAANEHLSLGFWAKWHRCRTSRPAGSSAPSVPANRLQLRRTSYFTPFSLIACHSPTEFVKHILITLFDPFPAAKPAAHPYHRCRLLLRSDAPREQHASKSMPTPGQPFLRRIKQSTETTGERVGTRS
jgi:hypothetical protein